MGMLQLKDLSPNPENPRTISKSQLDKLVRSIYELPEMLTLRPIIYDENKVILAGNMRYKGFLELQRIGLDRLAKKLKGSPYAKNLDKIRPIFEGQIPEGWAISAEGFTEDEKREFVIKDNIGYGEWDIPQLQINFDIDTLHSWGLNVEFDIPKVGGTAETIETPEEVKTDIKLGDIIEIGQHRIMCGDSTDPKHVEKLMDGFVSELIHSDPPYGMGKQRDGVENDNLYNEKLDKFQMEWLSRFLQYSDKNASLYIWGNPEPLWRLWFRAGLCDYDDLRIKNQIVWDKKNIPGMKSDLLTQYPIVSEHCLFIIRGNQFDGNINTDDYWEGFEPIRSYLQNEAKRLGIKSADIKKVCGVQMYGHWFTRSQWCLIPEDQYAKLQEKYDGFDREWNELKQLQKEANDDFRRYINSNRTYFNNSHEIMTDVWDFARVVGEERHGHATPKPVDMMRRIIKSSSTEGSVVAEPFLGSGSTLVGCHQLNRRCFAMELKAEYCQVSINRLLNLDNSLTVKINGKPYKQ